MERPPSPKAGALPAGRAHSARPRGFPPHFLGCRPAPRIYAGRCVVVEGLLLPGRVPRATRPVGVRRATVVGGGPGRGERTAGSAKPSGDPAPLAGIGDVQDQVIGREPGRPGEAPGGRLAVTGPLEARNSREHGHERLSQGQAVAGLVDAGLDLGLLGAQHLLRITGQLADLPGCALGDLREVVPLQQVDDLPALRER
jgi:hypothetical protein